MLKTKKSTRKAIKKYQNEKQYRKFGIYFKKEALPEEKMNKFINIINEEGIKFTEFVTNCINKTIIENEEK